MNQPSPQSSRSLLRRQLALALLLWTAGVTASWWWSYATLQERMREIARVEAATNINKDWSLRLWATSHGGVYVPPDEKTPPNPYLAHIPERDIITDQGKRLTLMNPAYMIRQIMKDYSDLYGVRGHITSLKLTNPINEPDAWETAALKSFQQGAKEIVDVADIEGQPYLRMMRPIPMEKGCMKCHGDIGIKVGEIRGGISTAIPMRPLYDVFRPEFHEIAIVHGLAWLLGLAAIWFMAWRSRREANAIDQYQNEINLLNRDLEQRVSERTAQLEASNEELEAFAYSVSHDLRTPLRAIEGYSHMLQDEHAENLDDEGRRLLAVVRDNAGRMDQLIDDILQFSRTGRSEMTLSEIDMEKLVREVVAEFQPSLADGRLQLVIQPLPPARGDGAMIRQVFVNLISNAVKFSRTQDVPRITVGGYARGNEVIYFVQDNGVGFDMQHANRLFGVFQRLHHEDKFEGTGIGLAIVKRIVTRHGGRVWAEGRVNDGATISFTLPNDRSQA